MLAAKPHPHLNFIGNHIAQHALALAFPKVNLAALVHT